MPKVLVADNNPQDRADIVHCLSLGGYQVVEATSGENALELAQTQKVDLILAEMAMPDLDGERILSSLRGLGIEAPVMFATGKLDSGAVADCMKHGLSDFILKPVKQEELQSKIEKILDGRELVAETEEAVKGFEILLVANADRVAQALRNTVPLAHPLKVAKSKDDALALCADHTFGAVIIDVGGIDESEQEIFDSIKEKQADANVFALYSRKVKYPGARAREQGYDGFLAKPFVEAQIVNMCEHPDEEEALPIYVSDIFVQPRGMADEQGDVEDYYTTMHGLIDDALHHLAADCCEEVILDLRYLPVCENMSGFISETLKLCADMALDARVVGNDDTQKVLGDAGSVPFFESISKVLDA